MIEISKEYASALFLLAQETKTEDSIREALQTILKIFQDNPLYLDLLASPSIPKQERIHAVGQAFQETFPEYAVSFVQLLCERNHIRDFEKCVEEYEAFYLASKEISLAQIRSVIPLTEKEKKQLVQKLELVSGHSIIPEFLVDTSLLGGIVVHMDGKVLDGSLKRRLHDMKEVINNEFETRRN